MDEIEYVFGTGVGPPHVWTSAADLSLASPGDALRLDFDGDGLIDDAMWDSAGLGIADVAALDLDDDGVLDHFYTDPTGLGTWNHHVTGTTADAVDEPLNWIHRADGFGSEGPQAPDSDVAQQDSAVVPCAVEPPFETMRPATFHPPAIHTEVKPPGTAADNLPHNDHTDLPDYLTQWTNRAGGDPGRAPTIA
ncbi:hypothetical protein [Nocardia brasiliensis]|uniref:hypothetical protein n=1 Tax=Nocardia brasiliensis TaxID=37326 RepID=UPI002458C041|nr:hypothetical protein [Nocardia brasiliensis]